MALRPIVRALVVPVLGLSLSGLASHPALAVASILVFTSAGRMVLAFMHSAHGLTPFWKRGAASWAVAGAAASAMPAAPVPVRKARRVRSVFMGL